MHSIRAYNFIIKVYELLCSQNNLQKFKDNNQDNTAMMLYVWSNKQNWQQKQQIVLPEQKIQQISIGEKHMMIRTENRILGFGNNSKGQLGTESYEQQSNSVLQICPRLIRNSIRQISCGWNHTLILDESGFAYSAGQGKNGVLGYGRGNDSCNFKPISSLKGIKFISAGKDHSLALSSIKVYGWGNSLDGQLGIPKQKICFQPQQLYVYASHFCFAGVKCSFFVSEKGTYSTGLNDKGQLGLGNKNRIKMPKKVIGIDEQIIQIQGSSHYTLFKTNKNQFFLSGSGAFGEFLYPTKIKHFKDCEQVYLGEQFGILRDSENAIKTWNNNNQFPTQNPYLSIFPIDSIDIGPKIVVCKLKNNFSMKQQGERKSARHQLGGQAIMARSSIQCSNNLSPSYNYMPNSTVNDRANQRKSRKQSQAIQGEKYNHHDQSYQWSKLKYSEKAGDQTTKPNFFKQKRNQQITSPYFNKQILNSCSRQLEKNEDQKSKRISGFEDDLEIQYSVEFNDKSSTHRNRQTNRPIQQSGRLIETIIQQQSPLCLASTLNNGTSKTLNKQMMSNKQQLNQRLEYLERQNRRKDECIRKMRKQLMELAQIIQSDEKLKNAADKAGKCFLTKKNSALSSVQFQQPDVFVTNAQLLRGMLQKSIDSLTYSG